MIVNYEFLSTAASIALFTLLAVAVATDLKTHRIPNMVLLTALVLAVLLRTSSGGIDGLTVAVSGLVIGLAMLAPLYLIGGMAAGDVKLLGVVGSFLGPWATVVAGLATMMAGALFGIAFIVWHRVRPTLDSHTAQIISPLDTGLRTESASSPTVRSENSITYIPYAPAIAVGTLAALWYLGNLPGQLL